jgi:hypothetical protein
MGGGGGGTSLATAKNMQLAGNLTH